MLNLQENMKNIILAKIKMFVIFYNGYIIGVRPLFVLCL